MTPITEHSHKICVCHLFFLKYVLRLSMLGDVPVSKEFSICAATGLPPKSPCCPASGVILVLPTASKTCFHSFHLPVILTISALTGRGEPIIYAQSCYDGNSHGELSSMTPALLGLPEQSCPSPHPRPVAMEVAIASGYSSSLGFSPFLHIL